jgi:hypothetical protein
VYSRSSWFAPCETGRDATAHRGSYLRAKQKELGLYMICLCLDGEESDAQVGPTPSLRRMETPSLLADALEV